MWTAPVLVAGPCLLERADLNLRVAEALAGIALRLGLRVIFKASFAKANRARRDAARGPGLETGLRLLEEVRRESGLPVLTDVHESHQVAPASQVVDALQIPAFLCRQTELLEAAGRTGLPVNIKKGQWMSPDDMAGAVEKVTMAGSSVVAVTERGTFFGYGDLVVDMRNFTRLKATTGASVLFDATHSVQQPGRGADGSSSGNREHVPALLRAAAAAGADGFFLETHPTPEQAPSDGATMWPLDQLESLIEQVLEVWARTQGRELRA
jgi:2-dehydro-3-deoxyphosphooctonate aldolase (KDO 8-P synthase)